METQRRQLFFWAIAATYHLEQPSDIRRVERSADLARKHVARALPCIASSLGLLTLPQLPGQQASHRHVT
jgi:hypothetical protein